ncbi:MAG TPA: dihydropteroate synthase [Candidatus Eremiobacteraceae bacterium]|jgi:dihydropteroate synthase
MSRSDLAYRRAPLTLRGATFAWGERTFVMGIINATPDSFSGDGIGADASAAVQRARRFAEAGCHILDIGGESTRPGHTPVSERDELRRVLPVIEAVRAAVDTPISIDTFKPAVARAALEAGADMVNCVWGAPPAIAEIAARAKAPLVIMHNRAVPDYDGDVVDIVIESLARSVGDAEAVGVQTEQIIVDPGIGFGKTAAHNIQILARLDEFATRLPYPLLVGTSRKSFIGALTALPVEQRAFGTAASVTLAIARGADIVRVHDVEDLMATVAVADAIVRDSA